MCDLCYLSDDSNFDVIMCSGEVHRASVCCIKILLILHKAYTYTY